jgi:hypothetical protein
MDVFPFQFSRAVHGVGLGDQCLVRIKKGETREHANFDVGKTAAVPGVGSERGVPVILRIRVILDGCALQRLQHCSHSQAAMSDSDWTWEREFEACRRREGNQTWN